MIFRRSLVPASKALAFVALATLASADEEHGDDHGDTYLSSTRLEYGVTMSGELEAGDTDVFRLDLQGRADIDVRGGGQLDTVGALLDSEGNVLGESDDEGPGLNYRFEETLDGGVYYVRVSSDMGDTGDYKITAYIVREDDVGDTSGNSTVLPLGVRATGRIDPATDRDVYRVEVPEEGELHLWTEGPTNTMGELRDSEDMVIESADEGGDRGNFYIHHAVEPGVFYLHITADAVGTYFAQAELDPGHTHDDDDDHHEGDEDDHVDDEEGDAIVTFFEDHISMPIVQARCVNCHVDDGVSGNTHLVFVRSTNPEHIFENLAAFSFLLIHEHEDGEEDPVGYVMTKVTGGNMHGGGEQITSGSEDYMNLESFLNMLVEYAEE